VPLGKSGGELLGGCAMDGGRSVADTVIEPEPDRQSIPAEDIARAEFYRLLAALLAAPPDAAFLGGLAMLSGDGSELGAAIGDLAQAAAAASVETVAREYHDLFIGIGRGELLPYASYYLTGFLHERPLAELRGTLVALGLARAAGVSEPEDHIAAVCEVMAGLIDGALGPPAPPARQREFAEAFVLPWAPRLFADLERAQAARFYASVGRIGRLFLAIEETAIAIA
jgi:TorA maturation chaperone TorD